MIRIQIFFLCGWIGISAAGAAEYRVGNEAIERTLTTDGGRLRTLSFTNHLFAATAAPRDATEFHLRLSQGTGRVEPDVEVSSEEFRVTGERQTRPGLLEVDLEHPEHGLKVRVSYEAHPGDAWMRKRLRIVSDRRWVLEQVDVEALTLPGVSQPYTKDAITAHAPENWSPNLGQPLYAPAQAMFFGLEFPAARNLVSDGRMRCGYLRGLPLEPGVPHETHRAVVGVATDGTALDDAFFDYIDRIRARPLRLQTQYNTWFDHGGGVRRESFAASVRKVGGELAQRGVRPLSAYVIDDGWQDTGGDWSDRVWKVNTKFDPDFASSRRAVQDAGARLGLWISPGCLFGASAQVPKLRAAGYEALNNWMSMAGPRYMQALEDRMAELVGQGVGFLKLDGLFGHLNTRNFELRGSAYGLPEMPQLGTAGIKSGDAALNDPKFDELKLYYLTAGAERLIRIFDRLGKLDPDLYIVISNGAWLSPWWLMHIDAVWMINADDAAGGSGRTGELVYRDLRYHRLFVQENTKFPLHSVFNHEPKKTSTGETKDQFRRYLYMNLSRGTGFVEAYIKPDRLAPQDWDVLAEGLRWCEMVFPAFKRARMHGGDPAKREVYGYSGWTDEGGYVSLHNPSGEEQIYELRLDRALGVGPGVQGFAVSSPMEGDVDGLPARVSFGDIIRMKLPPGSVRLIHADREARDWSALRKLQTRTPEPAPPNFEGHALLGVWEYQHGGLRHTRTFTADGWCVLAAADAVQWRRKWTPAGERGAEVEGGLRHTLKADGKLDIEGRYRGVRSKP